MATIQVMAPAKLNLTLDVLGRRPDSYHDMKMVMQSVTLRDELTLTTQPGEGIELTTDLPFLPVNGDNLAVAAAQALKAATGADWGRLSIHIAKRVPVCAGMAGGSSDAAAVLRGLNELAGLGLSREQLAKIGEQVGSDVPYCVWGSTALAEGRGEILSPLSPLPDCWIVIAKPKFAVSTPQLFHQLDGKKVRCRPDTQGMIAALEAGDLGGVARRVFNIFEAVLPDNRREQVDALKSRLIHEGALGAGMSGTGPTVFGIFDCEKTARAALEAVSAICPNTWLAQNA